MYVGDEYNCALLAYSCAVTTFGVGADRVGPRTDYAKET